MSDISVQQLPLTPRIVRKGRSISPFAVCCLSLCAVLLLTGCGAAPTPEAPAEISAIPVSVTTVGASRRLPVAVTNPGVVSAEQEVRVTANAGGVVKNVVADLGSSVTAGQVLARIIDANSVSTNAAQVENARLAMEQAKAAFTQAQRNVGHTTTTTDATITSAELTVESARLAVDQAKLTLTNKRALASQAEADAETNGLTTATMYANAAGGVLDGLNNLTGFDDKKSVVVSYSAYLGALDAKTVTAADTAYDVARRAYDDYLLASQCDTAMTCLTRTAVFLTKVKTAVDSVVVMLDKSVPAADFPLTSSVTTSLAGLKSTATGYQTTLNTGIATVNAATQTVTNTKLGNHTTIEQLEKSVALAEKQANQAAQSLASLKATNASTRDTVGTQVSTAELAYKNALVNYQNLTNNREVTAPISGVITKKSVNDGDAIATGQQLYTISKPGNVKVDMYVDEQQRSLVVVGAMATITNSDQSTHQAQVSRIAPSADPVSKRFLIELLPVGDRSSFPPVGAVVDVALQLTYVASSKDTFFVPLFALTIGQNESTIFIVEKELATAVTVTVVRVAGEYAEVQADVPDTARIITEGARSVMTGTKVSISK